MRASILALAASGALAQNFTDVVPAAQNLSVVASESDQFLAYNPGGGVPAGVQAPSISGFEEPTIQPSRGGEAVCVSGTVPVSANATNMKLNFEIPQNQTGVTQAFLSMLSSGSPFTKDLGTATQVINGTYNISATLCTPANNLKPDTVEILTHGIGFDKYYWDFASGYSYVDVAAQAGRATFFYDRLGVGQSSKPDAIQVVQTSLELEILEVLITQLKSGKFAGKAFSTIVGTGHSYGSLLTQGITYKYPKSLDVAILTGYSTNSTGQTIFLPALNLAIASQNQPLRFSGLSNGYLVSSTSISNQFGFLHAQNFDPNVLSLAEATKGSVTFGELFTQMAVGGVATNFTGSVAVVDGDADLPFCSGNCSYPTNQAQDALKQFPKAIHTGSYLAPLTGHGINIHYSATAAFEYIQAFITSVTATSSNSTSTGSNSTITGSNSTSTSSNSTSKARLYY